MCLKIISQLRKFITGERKTLQYIKCTHDHLKHWFQYVMPFGLTWANPEDWQIDHVIPLSFFDLTNTLQRHIGCHWSNIRPVREIDNRQKGTSLDINIIVKHANNVVEFMKAHECYQVDMVTCLWQTVEVWYGKNAQDDRNIEDFLKWIIRSQGSSL